MKEKVTEWDPYKTMYCDIGWWWWCVWMGELLLPMSWFVIGRVGWFTNKLSKCLKKRLSLAHDSSPPLSTCILPHLYASSAFVKGPTHLHGHPPPSPSWLATSTDWRGGSFPNRFSISDSASKSTHMYIVYSHTCMHAYVNSSATDFGARDSWCLRELIRWHVWKRDKLLCCLETTIFMVIWLRKRHQRPRISLVGSRWDGSALNLVGDLVLLQPLHQRCMSLYKRYELWARNSTGGSPSVKSSIHVRYRTHFKWGEGGGGI